MASNQTEHYGLNQWAPEDNFLRAEFNEDNRRVDVALAQKSEWILGVYQGNGEAYSGEQIIQIGFTPKAVLIANEDGLLHQGSTAKGGFAVAPGVVDETGTSQSYLCILPGGFRVRNSSTNFQLNYVGHSYYYMALR